MKTNFLMKGRASGFALKKRPKVIGKWPIALFDDGQRNQYVSAIAPVFPRIAPPAAAYVCFAI